ncbi:MAG: hypothetical protein ACHQVS_02205 [Candidatus Babeliales bacterium]
MKIMNYLVLGLALAACGNAFGAESVKQEEAKIKKQKAIAAMHSATTIEELEKALADGAQTDNILAYGVDSYGGNYRALLCSVAINPEAHEELIPWIVKQKGNMVPWTGKINVQRTKETVTMQDSSPIFNVVEHGIICDNYSEEGALSLLQKRCKALINVGYPLCIPVITVFMPNSPDQRKMITGDVFADAAKRNFENSCGLAQDPVTPHLYDYQCTGTLAICKVIHEAGTSRSQKLKEQLSDALRMMSLDIINRVIFQYICLDDKELTKIEEILKDPRAQSYLVKLEESQAKEAAEGERKEAAAEVILA